MDLEEKNKLLELKESELQTAAGANNSDFNRGFGFGAASGAAVAVEAGALAYLGKKAIDIRKARTALQNTNR